MADRTARAAAVMAVGTVLSRLLGFARIALLAAAIGTALRNDLFTVANTIPNSLYILLAGGVFNTVLVPQLVRAIKSDDDAGQEYTDRIITAGLVVLAVLTTACVILGPEIAQLYMPDRMNAADRVEQRAEVEFFTRLCLPQIFFYGAFVLVGQVLNARGRFGPMMWAPIANNVVAGLSIVGFMVFYRVGADPATYSTGESLLLGLGHTVGIAVQLLVLIPYLRSTGYRYRPRFGLRGTGLGKTVKLGLWTVLFVAVNQVTLIVVTRLALSGTASVGAGDDAAGVFAYSTAMLVFLVPHGIISVSLATAMLPRVSALAADGDNAEVARVSARSIRQALAIVVPAATAMFAFAVPAMLLIAGNGAANGNTTGMSLTLMALSLGLVPFTVQYFQLRTFYAFEDTRTPFLIQLVIAAVNITTAIVGVALLTDHRFNAVVLAGAYTVAYTVGVLVSRAVLRRRVPRVAGAGITLPAIAMGIAAAVAAAVAWTVVFTIDWAGTFSGPLWSMVSLAIGGAIMLPVYAALARVLRIHEVNDLVRTVTRRLPVRTGRA
jgi:putative peptidoglycan lipid II flippase